MELYKLIPKKQRHSSDWSVIKSYVMFKKLHNIPICYIENDIVWIFLDLRIQKQVIDIISHLNDLDVKFYFTHPEFSNPGQEFDVEKILLQYFRSYADRKFNKNLNKINFDIIKNLVEFTNEFSDFNSLKKCFQVVKKEVNLKWTDWYSRKDIYDYPEEIRQEFDILWREIQINNLL